MFKLVYDSFKDFGTFGAIVALLIVESICWCKLFFNHLKHINNKVDKALEGLDNLEKEFKIRQAICDERHKRINKYKRNK